MKTFAPLPFGFYPFWFWNDRLSEDEIRWQIAEMADKGIRGFFVHPRQGLKQPYLSDAFFRMVAVAVEAAEQHGLRAHLYDEYPYPSGVAGGEVILGNPEFHATILVQKTYDVGGGDVYLELPAGKVLSCVICPLRDGRADWSDPLDARESVGVVLAEETYSEMGLTRYNRKRYFATVPTPTLAITLPEGEWRVFVSVQTLVERHKYWWNFVDVLNPDAIAAFLQLTHERYYRRFGDRFGTTIPSIFVDETEPRWSARLPEAFRAEYGYELLPLLPALQDADHPKHLQVLADLARLRYKLFCRTFEEPIARWCAEHGLRYSGEKPSLRLSQLRYMDLPGCDAGHTKAGAKMDLLGRMIRGNARAAASAAYFYEKEGALCEAYHSLGWSATLQDIKLIAEALLLMGVPYLVPHGFFYSTHALKKHDAPPTFFFQMPYWALFAHLTRRLDRLTNHLENTFIDAGILLVEPAAGLPTRADLGVYRDVMDVLMEEHREFLHVDTDILQAGTVDNGVVRIRDVTASVVILPPMRIMEPTLELWLAKFERSGGTVLHCGPGQHREAFAHRLRVAAPASLGIEARSGDARKVQVSARRRGDRRLWLLLNTGGEAVDLTLDAGCALREIPLDDALPAMLTPSESGYGRALAPFESVLLEADPAEAPPAPLPPRLRVPIGGPMRVRPQQANLVRMYDWEMTLEDGGETRTVPAVPLANQLDAGKFRFTPVIDQFFGAVPELQLPSMRITYRFAFENAYDGPVELVMEPESLLGEWRITVNDGEPITLADFAPTGAHVRGSLGVDITARLRPGENALLVTVETDRLDGGLRNALYLAGDFGVALGPIRLVPRGEDGGFETWEENGLPFYAGAVDYETTVDLPALPPGDAVLAELAYERPFEEPAEIAFNDGPWRPALWTPRHLLLPTGELREGANRLRLRVYTALARAFEGQWFETAEHEHRDVDATVPSA